MAQPVWTLSVDLQTKTATFQSGMADAAKAARGSFNEIKSGAAEMGASTSYSMGEARHGVMLLGEEFGVHLPRGLTTFIASLGPVGAAMEAAFPFIAIAVGATLLIEHLVKLHEAAEKAATSQVNMGTTINKALTDLDDKVLEAGIRVDELNGNHLAALKKQLEVINNQSLEHLMSEFDIFAKSADAALAQLKTSWYQFGAGSAGAKNALDEFKTKYDSLLAQGKDKEAHDLLAGTVASAERVLQLQEQAKANQSGGVQDPAHSAERYQKYEEAKNALKAQGIGFTEQEVNAQQELVSALGAQVSAEQKIAELKNLQVTAAKGETAKKEGGDADKQARAEAAAIKAATEEAEKAWEENYRRAVSALQEAEKEKIKATQEGSAARLAAIDAAIKEEESKGLQETGFYKSLLEERVNITRQMGEEQKRVQAELDKEAADFGVRMGQLRVAIEEEVNRHRAAMQHESDSARLAEALKAEQELYSIQKEGFEKELAALGKSGKDEEVKIKQLQDREAELEQAHQNKLAQIRDKAEEQQRAKLATAWAHTAQIYSQGFTEVLMGHETFGKMMLQTGSQIEAGMLQNAMMSIMTNNMTKESDAAKAARAGFNAGMKFPFPANIALAPALGAAAFASVMAFEAGGIVPGVERGDVVPARLTPGEGVIPKPLMDNLVNAAKSGSMGGGDTHIHRHTHHYSITAMDSEGFDRVLEKNQHIVEKHVEGHIRKMNR